MKHFMTTMACTVLLVTALINGSVKNVGAEEEKPTAEAAVAVYSQYVWRGWAFSRDSLVIQPSVTVGYKGFGFNLWGNLDTDLYGTDSSSWNETDMTISYDGSAGMVGYSLGYIYYGLDGMDDSQEIYAGISLDVLLSPTLTLYKEITSLGGWYATLGISHSFALSDMLSLDLGATVGYYDDEAEYSELHNGLLSAALAVKVNDYVTVTPELAWSFALSSAASDRLEADNLAAIDKADDSFIYGGISVSFAF